MILFAGAIGLVAGVLFAERAAAERLSVSPAWVNALIDFTANPDRGGRELRRLARLEGMPESPIALVALGHAYQRSRQRSLAREALRRAVNHEATDGWHARALLALGWIELGSRDEHAAGRHFAAAADASDGDASALGRLMVERVEGVFGQGVSLAKLAQLAVDPAAKAELRLAAQLEAAYAHYWMGNYSEAGQAFDVLAATAPDSAIFDDAEYGSARARWARGDVDGARAAFGALAGGTPRGRAPRISRARLDLEAHTLTDRLVRRAQRLPPASPESRVLVLYDEDGVALARAALVALSDPDAPPSAGPTERLLRRASAARRSSSTADAAGRRIPEPTHDEIALVVLSAGAIDWLIATLIGVATITAGRAMAKSGHGRGTTAAAAAGRLPLAGRAQPGRPQRSTPSEASVAISASDRPRMSR